MLESDWFFQICIPAYSLSTWVFLIPFFFLLLLISVFKDFERGFHSWYSLCLSIPLSAVLGVEEVSNSTLLFSADFV